MKNDLGMKTGCVWHLLQVVRYSVDRLYILLRPGSKNTLNISTCHLDKSAIPEYNIGLGHCDSDFAGPFIIPSKSTYMHHIIRQG